MELITNRYRHIFLEQLILDMNLRRHPVQELEAEQNKENTHRTRMPAKQRFRRAGRFRNWHGPGRPACCSPAVDVSWDYGGPIV
jgi:hypothetical protein